MPETAAIMGNVRRAVLVDDTTVEMHRLRSPVGVDSVLEALGRRWHVIGVIHQHTEIRALCVPHRP